MSDSQNAVQAAALVEISKAIAANTQRVIAQAFESPYSALAALEMMRSAVLQNAEIADVYAEKFEREGNQEWAAICRALSEDYTRQAAILDPSSEDPLGSINDFLGGAVGSLDAQAQFIAMGAKSERLIKELARFDTALDLYEAWQNKDASKFIAGFAAGALAGFVSGLLVGGGIALGIAGWPLVAGVAVIGAFVDMGAESALNSVLEDLFVFMREDDDIDRMNAEMVYQMISTSGRALLPRLGDYVAFADAAGDSLYGRDDLTNTLIGGVGADSIYGGGLADLLSGGESADTIHGGGGFDNIKGGGGDDTLIGGLGSDRLDGGIGFDTYAFEAADLTSSSSEDVIVDSDGLGKITFGGVDISGTGIGFDNIRHASLGAWETANGDFRLAVIGTGDTQSLLIIRRLGDGKAGGRIVIKNWKNGDLGISLPGYDETHPSNSAPMTVNDDVFGEVGTNSGNDSLTALDGHDGLEGGAGNDELDGGLGNDLIFGGSGDDRLFGGHGNDIILDGSELQNLRAWDNTDNSRDENGKTELDRINDEIARLGASVVAKGAGWYVKTENGSAATGDPTLDGGYIIVTPVGGGDLDPNVFRSGADYIDAGDGSDRVHAGEGTDVILGGDGNDYINGGHDSDLINGGEGNDFIEGDLSLDAIPHVHFTALVSSAAQKHGDDVIDAGAGDDRVAGGGGNDIINGGDGADELVGRGQGDVAADEDDADQDYIDGGAGADKMAGDDGDDHLLGGADDDVIRGDNGLASVRHGNDRLEGGAGNDILVADGGDDQLEGGDGDDELQGDSVGLEASRHGKDQLKGGEGNDKLYGQGNDDSLFGGNGDDLLVGDGSEAQIAVEFHGKDQLFGGAGLDELQGGGGNDLLDGGTEDDKLFGQAGDDQLIGGQGDDILIGGLDNDSLSGGDGVDTLFGDEGNDTIDGGAGNDILSGGIGNDALSGGAGNDELAAHDGIDQLDGGAGDDKLWGGTGNDVLRGGADVDQLVGDEGHDELDGGSGGDTLYGEEDDDVLRGGDGVDYLYGGSGDDTLEGGADNDYLSAGDGINTYIVGPDTGNDFIASLGGSIPVGTTLGGTLKIIGVDPANVRFEVSGASLKLYYGSASVVISNYFLQYDSSLGGEYFPSMSPVTSITFDDGTVWGIADVKRQHMAGAYTAGDDSIVGYENDDVIRGGDGNDMLNGVDGNDTLSGDAGDDRLYGGIGSDTLFGGDGADVLEGDYGNDRLNGGAGNDTLRGQAHADTYMFARGDGQDVVDDNGVDAGADIIEYAQGISAADIEVRREGLDLILHTRGTTDEVKVLNVFQDSGQSSLGVEGVRFADGTAWSKADLLAKVLLGSDGNDVLTGYASDDIVVGAGGNDTLDGGVGNDVLDGGTGADSLSGGDGNDDLSGGAGNDALAGGLGDDTYRYAAGGGSDSIADDNGLSTVVVTGIARTDAYFRRDGANLVMYFRGSPGDQLTFNGWFDAATGLAMRGLAVDFGDGTPLSLDAAALDQEVLKAGDADDVIHGNDAANTISGLGGNDAVHAGGGDDVVLGGGGADQLFGDAGNDDLSGGDGEDRLEGGADNDRLAGDGGNDHLFGQAGDDTLFGGSGEDRLEGGDGIDHLNGEADNDILLGQAGNDVLQGGAGDDQMEGGIGDDQLDGGDGVDQLFGGEGADTLSGGLANDIVDGGAGADQLAGGDGDDVYTVDDIGDVVTEDANGGADTIRSSVSLALTDNVERLELTGSGAIDATGNASGNHLQGNQAANRLEGLAGDDTLDGQSGQDHLLGGAGNDSLDGGSGSDRLEGGAGDDTYLVDQQDDVVVEVSGEGNDVVLARSNYTLSEHVETLTLIEGSAAYSGTGNAGNNLITGNTSSNRLDGAAGADRMVGGVGGDTYVVDNVGDEAVELASEGTDTVESSIDYMLGASLENLTLTGTAHLSGTGNDGDNVLIGNAGNNRLDGGLGGDDLYGGLGDDYFVNDTNDDWIFEDAGEGTDTVERRYETNLALSGNVENLILVEGIKTGNGNELDNAITGNTGANTLGGWDGNDVVHGLDGDDSLFGGAGADVLMGGNGVDYLDGGEGIDHLEGGADNDVYVTDDAADMAVEAANGGTDQVQTTASYALSANIENLFLMGSNAIGGAGNDLDNYIAGNAAANVIHGLGGSDTIVAGGGNDTLIGGAGDDKYVVNATSGTDLVDNTGGGFDGVFFTDGIVRERLSFARDGNDLLISVDNASTPSVRVVNHFLGGDAAIDYVQPDGGFYLTTAQINQIVAGGGTGFDQVIEGTAAGEQLVGGSGKDLIKGMAGADQLFGLGGNDTLQGGDGDDYLSGGNGSGSGSADDRLEGGIGNDTLAGEDGNDTLLGGAGDDDYVYGGGQDVIDNTGGGIDGVFFNNGITAAQLSFARTGDDLVIIVGGNASQTVTVTNHFLGGDNAIDFVQPASGAMLDTAAINALVGGGGDPGGGDDDDYPSIVTGTAAGEQLLGTNDRDLVRGLGGNDTVFGFNGDDKLDGGDGDDYLSGGNGSHNGSGNDILVGGAGVDQLVGEDGNDQMFGGAGNDKYIYGGGADTIDNTGGGTDWLHFNSSAYSVARSRITFHRDVDDLIVRVDGNAATQVRVAKHFLGGEYAIAYVQPAGGNAIPASQFGSLLAPLSSTSAPMEQLASETPLAMTSTIAAESLDTLSASSTPSNMSWKDAMEALGGLGAEPAAANEPIPPSRELQSLVEAMSSFGSGASTGSADGIGSEDRFERHFWGGGMHQINRKDVAHLHYMER